MRYFFKHNIYFKQSITDLKGQRVTIQVNCEQQINERLVFFKWFKN